MDTIYFYLILNNKMKILRITLNALSAESLRQKEMDAIIGGKSCGCSCYWENQGGSSVAATIWQITILEWTIPNMGVVHLLTMMKMWHCIDPSKRFFKFSNFDK